MNAGSDTVSSFRVSPDGLQLAGTAPSGGTLPISLAYHEGLLYVLNAGSPNSVSGLRVDADGGLAPLAGSTRPLSAAVSGPAQIEFSRDDRALVVTEKATSRIDTYSIGPDGLAGAASVQPSAGATPFGFAFDQRGHLIVSHAFGGAPGAGALDGLSGLPASAVGLAAS